MYQNALVLEQRTEHFFYQIVSDNESNIAQYLKDWPLKMQKKQACSTSVNQVSQLSIAICTLRSDLKSTL